VLQRLGRLDEALERYRHALAVFRRTGDLDWEARLLCNRGVLYAYRGAFRMAEADLLRAEQLHLGLGHEFAAAQVRSNLGFVAAAARAPSPAAPPSRRGARAPASAAPPGRRSAATRRSGRRGRRGSAASACSRPPPAAPARSPRAAGRCPRWTRGSSPPAWRS